MKSNKNAPGKIYRSSVSTRSGFLFPFINSLPVSPPSAELPKLVSILSIDSIEENSPAAIDVTREMSNGQRRWCFFVTLAMLGHWSGDQNFGSKNVIAYNAPHMIIVSHLDEKIIEQTLHYIEGQGALLECTKLIEQEDGGSYEEET